MMVDAAFAKAEDMQLVEVIMHHGQAGPGRSSAIGASEKFRIVFICLYFCKYFEDTLT